MGNHQSRSILTAPKQIDEKPKSLFFLCLVLRKELLGSEFRANRKSYATGEIFHKMKNEREVLQDELIEKI